MSLYEICRHRVVAVESQGDSPKNFLCYVRCTMCHVLWKLEPQVDAGVRKWFWNPILGPSSHPLELSTMEVEKPGLIEIFPEVRRVNHIPTQD